MSLLKTQNAEELKQNFADYEVSLLGKQNQGAVNLEDKKELEPVNNFV